MVASLPARPPGAVTRRGRFDAAQAERVVVPYDAPMRPLCVLILALAAAPALAQDAARGARLYADTARLKGKPVAACSACHADREVLRDLIRNRGGKPDDMAAVARRLDAVIAGAQPGAVNAKAQYRGVLTGTDLRDLAAYIARAKQAGRPAVHLAAAPAR